jgi:mannitol/fructose-specific phosphotransferase system IIA component (Ntr-type)
MNLASLLTPDQVVLDMRADEHLPAIEELVDHLFSLGKLPTGLRDEVLQALKQREEQVSTGIGSGVAIPHAFSEKIDEVIGVFGRSKRGIDFAAPDNGPVHFVILFVVPRRDYQLHLQTLAAIAKRFTSSEVRKRLSEAMCRTDILKILAGKAPGEVGGLEP